MMRPARSKLGIVLCLIYIVLIICCVGLELWGAAPGKFDTESLFVLLQFPVGLQSALLEKLGLLDLLKEMNWFEVYVIMGLPTLIFLYLLGWALGRLVGCVARTVRLLFSK